MRGEKLPKLLEISLRRNDDPARSHDRLGDEPGDGVGSFPVHEVFDLLHQPVGELFLRLAGFSVAVVMRARHMHHVFDRQIEIRVNRRQTGEAARRHRYSVIALDPADEFFLRGTSPHVIAVPGELHLHVVGFRARGAEQYFRRLARHELLQLFGKLDRQIV